MRNKQQMMMMMVLPFQLDQRNMAIAMMASAVLSIIGGSMLVLSLWTLCSGLCAGYMIFDKLSNHELPSIYDMYEQVMLYFIDKTNSPTGAFECSLCKNGNICNHHHTSTSNTSIGSVHRMEDVLVPSALNSELEKFLAQFLDSFVLSWFAQLSDDTRFVEEIANDLQVVIARLRLRLENWTMISQNISKRSVGVIVRHLQAFLPAVRSGRIDDVHEVINGSSAFSSSEHGFHVAVLSSPDLYLRRVLDIVLPLLLPATTDNSVTVHVLLREITMTKSLLPILNLFANGDTINRLIVLVLSTDPDPVESGRVAAEAAVAHENTELVPLFMPHFNSVVGVRGKGDHGKGLLGTSLPDILAQHYLLDRFMDYLRTHNAVALLKFMLAVEDYLEASSQVRAGISSRTPPDLGAEARNIFNVYMDGSAHDHLNLPEEAVMTAQRELVEAEDASGSGGGFPAATCFMGAYDYVYRLLSLIYVPMWVRSGAFLRLHLAKKREKGTLKRRSGIQSAARVVPTVANVSSKGSSSSGHLFTTVTDPTIVSSSRNFKGSRIFQWPSTSPRLFQEEEVKSKSSFFTTLPSAPMGGLVRSLVNSKPITSMQSQERPCSSSGDVGHKKSASLDSFYGNSSFILATNDRLAERQRLATVVVACSPIPMSGWRAHIGRARIIRRGSTSKDFVLYTVTVEVSVGMTPEGARVWSVDRRYKEFDNLCSALRTCARDAGVCLGVETELPSKRKIGNLDPMFIERRRLLLCRFIDLLLSNDLLTENSLLYEFLTSSEPFTTEYTSFILKQQHTRRSSLQQQTKWFPSDSSCHEGIDDGIRTSLASIEAVHIDEDARSPIEVKTDESRLPQWKVANELSIDTLADAFFYIVEYIFFVDRTAPRSWLRCVLAFLRMIGGRTINDVLERFVSGKLQVSFTVARIRALLSLLHNSVFSEGQEHCRTKAAIEKSRIEATDKLCALFPDLARTLVGKGHLNSTMDDIISLFQDDLLNQQLVYSLFDIILEECFPEIVINGHEGK